MVPAQFIYTPIIVVVLVIIGSFAVCVNIEAIKRCIRNCRIQTRSDEFTVQSMQEISTLGHDTENESSVIVGTMAELEDDVTIVSSCDNSQDAVHCVDSEKSAYTAKSKYSAYLVQSASSGFADGTQDTQDTMTKTQTIG